MGAIDLDDRHYEHWRDDICDQLLHIDTPRSAATQFGVRIDVMPLDGPVVLDVNNRHRGLEFVLTAERIARGDLVEAVGLTVVLNGGAYVRCAGSEVELRPGDLSLLDSREPFRKVCSADYREQFVLLPMRFVEATLGAPFARADQLVAPHEGLGRVLADSFASLAGRRAEIGERDWPALLAAITHMTAAVFGRDPSREAAQPSAHTLMRQRAERYIDGNLGDPELSPGRIAAALGCSTRYLHLIFEAGGVTVGERVRARRLERCRARLADPRQAAKSISEIAFEAGFNDAAHFSRLFKSWFGMTPSEARQRR